MSGQAGPSILVEMHEQISFQLRIRTLPKLFEELVNTIILFFCGPAPGLFFVYWQSHILLFNFCRIEYYNTCLSKALLEVILFKCVECQFDMNW